MDVVPAASLDPFDLSRGSPLPAPGMLATAVTDPVLDALRRVTQADAGHDPTVRVEARLALADALLERHAIGAALDPLRFADRLMPSHPPTLDRLARVLSRTGAVREAASIWTSLARLRGTVAAWEQSLRAWIRVEDSAEAQRALEELQRQAGEAQRVEAISVALARLQGRGAGGAGLVPRLLDAALDAKRRDDAETWRRYSLDAWVESRGQEAGELLADALCAVGQPRAAVYVAAESAARALSRPTPDRALAARLLARCARVAESAALPGEATAAWTARALLPDAQHEARESLRDILAERGRSVELSVRLRADARRAPVTSRAAAWKGVAAIEMPHQPTRAAQALAQALACHADDAEALELLHALVQDAAAESAVRDALWGLVRTTNLPRATRTSLLLWLGSLEERAGDEASADMAYALVDGAVPQAFEGLGRVHEVAESHITSAERALDAVSSAAPDAVPQAVEQLLTRLAATPGALRDARQVAKVLGSLALDDERLALLWLRVARRSDDRAQYPMVLRRLATRASVPAVRVRAAVECAEAIDVADGAIGDAVELLTTLLDELPGESAAAATLAAIAERAEDPTLSREALRAVARSAVDPWEMDFLARFVGQVSGIFAVFAACLSDGASSVERGAAMQRLQDLVGESSALLAQRTRALLSQTREVDEGLSVARRFATFDPLSPEAAIAWFGAANLASDASQVEQSLVAVTESLATLRDIAAVTRSAITRLAGLNALLPLESALQAAIAVGVLSDRALRTTLADIVERHPLPQRLRWYEALVASTETSEQPALLRRLAERYRAVDDLSGEMGALTRLHALRAADVLPRLIEVTARCGLRARTATLLSEQLEGTLDPAARRRLVLAMAAEFMVNVPARRLDAVAALDRLSQEQPDDETQGEVVRGLLAIGQPDAAVTRLVRWAGERTDEPGVVTRLRCAARVAAEQLRDPERALTILKSLIRRAPGAQEALVEAEDVAARTRAVDAMLSIYQEARGGVAGAHGAHALAYREAVFLERVGDFAGALERHLAMFERAPAPGAVHAAVERLAERLGKPESRRRALELMAGAAPSPEGRAQFLLQAAELSQVAMHDETASLELELRAYREGRAPWARDRVLKHARAVKTAHPVAARQVVDGLIDDELNAAAQTWDDDARRNHTLRALELIAVDTDDVERAQSTAALVLRQAETPGAGKAQLREILARPGISPAMQDAVLAGGGLARSSRGASGSLTPRGLPPRTSSLPSPPAQRISVPSPEPRPLPRTSTPTPAEPKAPVRASIPSTAPVEAKPSLRTSTPAPLPRTSTPAPIARDAKPLPRTSTPPPIPSALRGPSRPPATPSLAPSLAPTPASSPPELSVEDVELSVPPPAGDRAAEPPPPPTRTSPVPAEPAPMPDHVARMVSEPPILISPLPPNITPSTDPGPLVVEAVPTLPPMQMQSDAPFERLSFTAMMAAPPPLDPPSLDALRTATMEGNDTAASVLAERLAKDPDTRDEAIAIQRRRLHDDPARLDALDALIGLYSAMGRDRELRALTQVRAVLEGAETIGDAAPALASVPDPPDGVAKVLFPTRWGPFPELGALLVEALGATWRREHQRTAGRESELTRVFPNAPINRSFHAALRVLQLPRTVGLAMRERVEDGVQMMGVLQPPSLLLEASLAQDAARVAFILGYGLERARVGHLPLSMLPPVDFDRLVRALVFAFGPPPSGRIDPAVGAVGGRLLEGLPPRAQRAIRDLVQELGDRLTAHAWRDAVWAASVRAGLLTSGEFRVAAEVVMAKAPKDGERALSSAIHGYEPLRELVRFATSEEYLLLRW